jgi:hypothetical protein
MEHGWIRHTGRKNRRCEHPDTRDGLQPEADLILPMPGKKLAFQSMDLIPEC